MTTNKCNEFVPRESADNPGRQGAQGDLSKLQSEDSEKFGKLHGSSEHSFDGIQELDNPMPRWWINLFIVSIIFAVGYLAWYHLPFFPSKYVEQVYHEETKEAQKKGSGAEQVGFDFSEAAKDSTLVAEGKQIFQENCVSCHANLGQGLVGPNLTDDFWISGSTGPDLVKVVAKGVADKGMPAWENILGATKINKVVSFIYSIQGTRPAGAKEAQGKPGTLQ